MSDFYELTKSVRVTVAAPVDGDRYTVATVLLRDALVTGGRAYEGLQVYVEAERKLFILTDISGPTWYEIFSTSGAYLPLIGGTLIGPLILKDDNPAIYMMPKTDAQTAGTFFLNSLGIQQSYIGVTGADSIVHLDIFGAGGTSVSVKPGGTMSLGDSSDNYIEPLADTDLTVKKYVLDQININKSTGLELTEGVILHLSNIIKLMIDKDNIYLDLTNTHGKDNILKFRKRYYNERLAEFVLNNREINRLKKTDNELIQLYEPIYITPDYKNGRAQFFAPAKKIGNIEIPTFWFNVFIIWFMIFILYILLVFNIIRKLLDFNVHLFVKYFKNSSF